MPRRPSSEQLDLYTGNANPELARKIARYLGRELGRAEVFEFANENIFVKIEDNVRERDVFLVQPTCSPVQKSIMELLIMIDAFKRASAGRITAVVPYYAYGRSDKKDQPRVPITARLIADMISVAGADRVLTMDLHQGQIQGFFNIPVDELTAVPHARRTTSTQKDLEDLVVVTDLGFAKRARTFAELLDAPLAVIEKRRVGQRRPRRAAQRHRRGPGQARDHRRRRDRHRAARSSRSTARWCARASTEIYACATHGVLSDPAIDRHPRVRDQRGRRSPTPSRCRPPSACAASRCSPSRRSSARPSSRIHRGESVGALFS